MSRARFASGDAVPFSWPTRWAGTPTVHVVDAARPLLTLCGRVISGPRWVVVDELDVLGAGIRFPADAVRCPCSGGVSHLVTELSSAVQEEIR